MKLTNNAPTEFETIANNGLAVRNENGKVVAMFFEDDDNDISAETEAQQFIDEAPGSSRLQVIEFRFPEEK